MIRDREEVIKKKGEFDGQIDKMRELIELEDEEKRKRDKEEQERLEKIEEQKRVKIEMEDAARYIQRKWVWFQEVGRFLAKKRKKKKGKKKSKK